MLTAYFDSRRRIHDKAERSPAFESKNFGSLPRAKFYGATDALLDAGDVLWTVARGLPQDIGGTKLACYGFLQALYVQQDAVQALCDCLGVGGKVTSDKGVAEVRALRNQLVGHPARAEKGPHQGRPSAGILTGFSGDGKRLRGAIYFDDGYKAVDFPIDELITKNERGLLPFMNAIEAAVDERVRSFEISTP